MAEKIEFVRRDTINQATNKRGDEVVVLRDGREVAALPEADRLERALSLSFEEAKWIATHFEEIMRREPTSAEAEFWRAIADYKFRIRSLFDSEVPAAN